MKHLISTEYPPIAYLPGASGQARVWETVADVLGRRREKLLFDYPGLGNPLLSHDIHSLSDLADWLVAQLPHRCDIAAISMASALALRLALAYAERVRRLVLVMPCGGVNAQRFGALDWRDTFLEERPHAPRWFVNDARDFSGSLAAIEAPTLIICGNDDPIAPPAIGQFLVERLPNARLEIVADAGHDLEQEYPVLLASLIEAHLRR